MRTTKGRRRTGRGGDARRDAHDESGPASPRAAALALQRSAGNRAAQAMARRQEGLGRSALPPAGVAGVTTLPVQRALDGDGRLPADEKSSFTDFLEVWADPALFPATSLEHLEGEYDKVKALDEAMDGDTGDSDKLSVAYYELAELAVDLEVAEGTRAWEAAVEADDWPLPGDPPPEFTAAVVAARKRADEEERLEAERLGAEHLAEAERLDAQEKANVRQAYNDYRDDGRLLPGTINAIRAALPADATAVQVRTRLAAVYAAQATVSRDNWLTHLKIAGSRISGGNALHFTTFNDAVTTPGGALSVAGTSVPALTATLFATVGSFDQVHATVVQGPLRAHRYWDTTLVPAVVNATALGHLDREHARMVETLTALVRTAHQQHGRVGGNVHARQTTKAVEKGEL